MAEIFKMIYEKNKSRIFLLSLLTVSASVLGIILPYLNGRFIDRLISMQEIAQVYKIIFLIIVLGVFNIFANYMQQILSSKLIIKSIYDFRIEMLKHLRKISILKYKEFDPIYLNERTRKDISEVVNVVIDNYTSAILKIIIFITCLVIVGDLNLSALICILLIMPVYIIIYIHYRKSLYDSSFRVKEEENVFFQIYNEQLQLMEEIKIDSKYENHDKYLDNKFNNYFNSFSQYISLSTKFNTVESIISLIFQAALFVFGAVSILRNRMSIGELTIINSYFAIMIGIINYYVSLGKIYQISKVSFDRLKKINDIDEEGEGEIRLESITEIDFDLNFSFKSDFNIIKGEKAKFSLGKIYAIKGSNGSGKTTLVKLLIGLYHPKDDNSSRVSYNNKLIKEIDLEYTRNKKIAFVSQAHRMTNKKIKELFMEIDEDIDIDNLEKYLSYLNDKEMILKTIDIIRSFWDSSYYELSEGEKQILAIFRILCKKPEILILDEPTSNLDLTKKKLLEEILKNVKGNMIVIIISHDKSFLEISDEMIDLKA